MLVRKELSGIPLLPVPACEGKHAHLICAVQIVELPKSGKVLVADYFSPEEPYSLYARFFSDGNGWLTVREWPAQSWTKQQPVSWQRTCQFGAGNVWSPADDAELALSFLPVWDCFFRPMAAHNAGCVVESFMQLNMEDFSICQIHGFGDRNPTAPEKAFCELFAKQLKAAMTAGKECAA